jgi:uncharacterized protein
MILCDVNVLIYAHRADAPNHAAYRTWLENVINENAAYAVSDIILSGFLRVVTHPRVFAPPSSVSAALTFAGQLRQEPNAVMVMPENRHWTIFTDLCRAVDARGNLIPDAFLAALAIENGSEWITTDRDFSRFPGLNWRHPLEE